MIAIHIGNDYHITPPGPVSKAVLVTGCSSGIGRATALTLARAGFPVWASARRPVGLGELELAGCRVVELDVTDEQSRVAAVRKVEAEHGPVGVLINNAGRGTPGPAGPGRAAPARRPGLGRVHAPRGAVSLPAMTSPQ